MSEIKDTPDKDIIPFRGKKEQIEEHKNKIVDGIEIISSIQEQIVFSDKRIITVYGCAGSRKTDTLCKYGLKQFREKKNILFLTLISSVTHEIKTRAEKMFAVDLIKKGNHYFNLGKATKPTVEISTMDAFIYKQLDFMQGFNANGIYDDVTIIDDLNESTYKQRMYKLLNSDHDKFVMKNDKFADVILIDEFQDFEMDKTRIITNILKHNPQVKCMVIGDYLQTIFERSIVVDDNIVDHPFEFWQKSFVNEESYEDFEINICYRCPNPQINFLNHVMEDTFPRKKYQIANIEPSNLIKPQSENKPFIFIHEDIGSGGKENTNGAYIADQVFRIMNTIIEHDDEKLDYSDVTILMLKSNTQPVFKQLEELMNLDPKSKSKFHIHETKGDGYHDRIDWSKSEGKATALSIHGYKGRGNKIVFFLGLNNMNMPRKDNIDTPKELIDYSLLNVGLSRSQKYLIIGITSSSPTKYLYDKQNSFEKYAYCSWTDNMFESPMYMQIKKALYNSKWNRDEGKLTRCFKDKVKTQRHWHTDKCKVQRDSLWFDKYYYTDKDIYPKHRVGIVTDAVCDVIDDPEDILPNCTKGERLSFGKSGHLLKVDTRLSETNRVLPIVDDYEKKILGIVAEWIVNRYLFVNTNDVDFLKYMNFMLEDGSKNLVYFTNNESLLNLVADKETNKFAIHHIYDDNDRKSEKVVLIWRELFEDIRRDHESLLNRDGVLLNKLETLSSGLPRMIVHSNFKNQKFIDQLLTLCDSKISNDNIKSDTFWNFGLFQMLLFEKIRTPYLSSYYDKIHHNLEIIHTNTNTFCKEFIKHRNSIKQLSHGIEVRVNEDLILGSRTQKKKQKRINVSDIYGDNETNGISLSKPFIISGRSDLYLPDCDNLLEVKASSFVDISNTWITQILTYCCLPLNDNMNGKSYPFNPKRFQIVNLLKGIIYSFELPGDFNKQKCLGKIMKKLKWPDDVIIEYCNKYK